MGINLFFFFCCFLSCPYGHFAGGTCFPLLSHSKALQRARDLLKAQDVLKWGDEQGPFSVKTTSTLDRFLCWHNHLTHGFARRVCSTPLCNVGTASFLHWRPYWSCGFGVSGLFLSISTPHLRCGHLCTSPMQHVKMNLGVSSCALFYTCRHVTPSYTPHLLFLSTLGYVSHYTKTL